VLSGSLGICLFFYHYSRYTAKRLYADFAGCLLDDIIDGVHKEMPLNFKNGLCGIGWGIEYLIRNHFVEADADEVLEEFDRLIVEWDVRKIADGSLRTGLAGVGCYVVSRLHNRKNSNRYLTDEYCRDLVAALKRTNNAETNTIAAELSRIMQDKYMETVYNPLIRIVNKTKFDAKNLFDTKRPLGIDRNGFAGIGLKLLKIWNT
jgi:lantibiotic modifying enzyme